MTLRVAVVGAGPAGIYAADILTKSEVDVSVDLFERLPAPFGLVRYGVAPDHPRIKEIIKALQRVLAKPEVRFIGNVDYGTDVKLEELREFYDAVIFSTGAMADRDLRIPGEDLKRSYGAADFVSWYDSHPDVPQTWDFGNGTHAAVIGVGNVALDVARVLAKTADEMLVTDIPEQVHAGLASKKITDVHVFARRGPAYAKFSPMELRELNHSPNVEVIVHPEGFEVDDHSMEHISKHKTHKLVLDILANWVGRDIEGKPHRIHLHFMEAPTEVLGEDGEVVGLRTERTELVGDGSVRGTGEFTDWPVQSVYRAVGYASSPLLGLPFDERELVIPNEGGRVLGLDGDHVPNTFVTGWVKRGPVGLIGHTKSDAAETVGHVLETTSETAPSREPADVDAFLRERGIDFVTVEQWEQIDAAEIALGEAQERQRVKLPTRADMLGARQA
ncbi:FAD-dependent oxidoreductase [Nocardioides daphniae]|uniref:ferredoxin--NADP(+) reductase n=1 Tax=Nocardioides daphniae TaxID=402297 RepID=A0ABQ1QJ32_9ACTN|nr:FAD-dependent oxidoreductase [Nocardioides daphniae]GGD28354.1 NADPH-ferredoxin reductase FprA [Nocardioides daphniae]